MPENASLDPEQEVYRDNDSGNVVAIYSNPIKTYIVSDKLCYLVKNNNMSIDETIENHPVATIATLAVAAVAGFLIAPVAALGVVFAYVAINSGNPTWGTGLIGIYHEAGIGEQGKFYAEIERGYISLDAKTKQLKIKRGWTSSPYSFDIDGWSGRYGMPLEFLLSIHIATQMPDLAMEIATTFDTDVQVLLHPVDKGKVIAGFNVGPGNTEDSDFVTWEQIYKIASKNNGVVKDTWNKLVSWGRKYTDFIDDDELVSFDISSGEFYELFCMRLPHAEGCTCCIHIPGGLGSGKEDACEGTGKLVTGEGFELGKHEICDKCKKNIKKMVAALKIIQDNNWNSYSPYISRVKDHWFRDVYFVIDNVNNTEVVLNDEAYYYQTGERWSVYETYTQDDANAGSIPEGFEIGDYKLYRYNVDNEGNEHYILSKLSKDQVEEINERIAEGDTSVSRLVKKPVTKILTAITDELGQSSISGIKGNRWTAYDTADTSLNWAEMAVTEDTKDELKDFGGKLYYKENRPNDIVQIEDGQRTATNSDIKKMFVDNKYYQYDGTVGRANDIREDRKKHNSTTYAKTDADADPTLLGKVSITKDSLTAFSILENTHTLDADYIYKDFKELIVELNYFDKEDLTPKLENVMTWILPETSASGWPVRKYDKSEVFYGTLIHSEADMTLRINADIAKANSEIEQLENEDGSTSSGTITPTENIPTGSVADLVNKGYEVHKIMEDGGGWDYCQTNVTGCNHVYGHSCGLDATIQLAQANNHNTCCATYISWVLKEVGFDLSNHPGMHGAHNTYVWCVAEGWTPITDYNELKPGDLLFSDGTMGTESNTDKICHVQMLGNNGEWLNAGEVDPINNPPKAYTSGFIIGMRSQLNGAAQTFKGYKPGEPVVSPITGKIIDHGTVTRTNEETGNVEEVEFIKIQAIDKYMYNVADTIEKSGRGYEKCKGPDEANTFDAVTSDKDKKREGYDYFYDEYRGVLDGFVMYIEGFDLTLYDDDGAIALVKSGVTDSSVTRYQENTVNNMTDDLEEARSWYKEDAKAAALPILDIGGDIYIKEGTIIGKTCDDPADMSNIQTTTTVDADGNEIENVPGNGNYIRLILRNLDDSIVEDVETYFKITDTWSYNGSVGNIQNIESMDPNLASLIEQKAGPLESQYPGIVNILKAIAMNESSGGTDSSCMNDPMQAAESTGQAAGSDMGSWENSVNAGIAALQSAWDKANGYGIQDLRVVIQAYNMGPGFVDYVHNQGNGTYTKALAQSFSDMWKAQLGTSVYGDPNYIDPKIYNYLPDLNV